MLEKGGGEEFSWAPSLLEWRGVQVQDTFKTLNSLLIIANLLGA